MTSRVGIGTAALAAALGMAAGGLMGCTASSSTGPGDAGQLRATQSAEPAPRPKAAPRQLADQPINQIRGLMAASHGPNAYGGGLCRCPPPVHYSDAEIKAISAALRALPDNNPLQQAMSDYENERDNLRICLGR